MHKPTGTVAGSPTRFRPSQTTGTVGQVQSTNRNQRLNVFRTDYVLKYFRMNCVLKYQCPYRLRSPFGSPFQSGPTIADADYVWNWYCQFLPRSGLSPSVFRWILSERDGARAGEENEGRYGRCDFAVHDELLMISRMRTTGFNGQRADRSAVSLSNRGQKIQWTEPVSNPAVGYWQQVFKKRSPTYDYLAFDALQTQQRQHDCGAWRPMVLRRNTTAAKQVCVDFRLGCTSRQRSPVPAG